MQQLAYPARGLKSDSPTLHLPLLSNCSLFMLASAGITGLAKVDDREYDPDQKIVARVSGEYYWLELE